MAWRVVVEARAVRLPAAQLPATVAVAASGGESALRFLDPEGKLPAFPVTPSNRPDTMLPAPPDVTMKLWLPAILYDHETMPATVEIASKLPVPCTVKLNITERGGQELLSQEIPLPGKLDGRIERFTPDVIHKLPLELPPIENFGPTAEGEPPLARVKGWATPEGCPYELSTMPGFAGSSAYYLRYMDPHNDEALVGKEADEYWRNVDLYVGGIEHATGHLMYSRFWNMFLYDLGCVCEEEPFRKLVNQGMIQGRSNFVYRIVGTNRFERHWIMP